MQRETYQDNTVRIRYQLIDESTGLPKPLTGLAIHFVVITDPVIHLTNGSGVEIVEEQNGVFDVVFQTASAGAFQTELKIIDTNGDEVTWEQASLVVKQSYATAY